MQTPIRLDAEASKAALESAIRTQATIVLTSPAFRQTTINGFLLSGDAQVILMEVSGRPQVEFSTLQGAHCRGQVHADQHYSFATRITATQERGESQSLALERPQTIAVFERRRSRRAILAPSSEVRLQWRESGRTHRHRVSLLNVSPDGLACRVEDAVAAGIDTNECLRASFELPGFDTPIVLGVRIKNKTPGSEGCTILGLQIVKTEADADAILALRNAVEARRSGPVETEVCV